MQITIDVPDKLGRQLEAYRERLPELLERGLQLAQAEPAGEVGDVRDIVDLLASQPTPAQILAIRPSAALQARVSELLARSKSGTLCRTEEAELERYLMLEHLVRLAKARALAQRSAE
ncbi:MAG: hypothetical protein KC425_03150 [Anaerolineales bacterium]|nr:hypothetical protein [Anaerolineales bacterium]